MPVVAKERMSHPVRRVLSRIECLISGNMGRFRMVTRRLACCKISLCGGRVLPRLVRHVSRVPNIR